jgi:tetratricopeptide (TPR) repeat protein
MHGRFQEAEALMEEAQRLGEQAEDPLLTRCYAFHHEGLLRAWERHPEMTAFDLTARPLRAALYSGAHWQNGGSAFTYSRVEAFEQTELYLSLIPNDDWPLVHNPPAFMHLGEPLALCGPREAAQRVYDLLLPAQERCLSWGMTKCLWDGTATRVLGLLAARLEDYQTARKHFEAAVTRLEQLECGPYLARTRYEYGRALLGLGRPADRDPALALIEQAKHSAQQLDLRGLRELCERRLDAPAASSVKPKAVPSAPTANAAPTSPQFVAEGEFWTIRHAAGSFRMRDSLGLHYLARLFAEPNRPIHVLELCSGDAQASAELGSGDAGELLDQRAIQTYKQRARELQEELSEAEAFRDAARISAARRELEFLSAELSRAVSLGGRTRRAGSASERARSSVQRRIRNVIERVRKTAPELAPWLERTVKTGTYCVFTPEAPER